MQKTNVLASALLWMMMWVAPSVAADGVELYGVADAFVKFGDWRGDQTVGVDDSWFSGDRIGLRGKESLGDGLVATFVLEQGYALDTGKSEVMSREDSLKNEGSEVLTRQAWVGLEGAFGRVALGRQYAPGYFTYAYDALLSAVPSPQSWLSLLGRLSITPNSPARWNNAVTWEGGFRSLTFSAIHSAGNRETARADGPGEGDDDKDGVALRYDGGAFKAGAIAHVVRFDGEHLVGGRVADETQKEGFFGASYDFGVLRLAGSWQRGVDVQGVGGFDVSIWQFGVLVPFGPNNLHFAYGKSRFAGVGDGEGGRFSPSSWTVAWTRTLSKRTTAYAGYTAIDHDGLDWGQMQWLGQTDATRNGHAARETVGDTGFFFVGMRHVF